MSFRSSENLQRYEYVRFHLDNVIKQPANNQSKKKTGYRFTINDRSTMFDFFNGYFEVTKELQKKGRRCWICCSRSDHYDKRISQSYQAYGDKIVREDCVRK